MISTGKSGPIACAIILLLQGSQSLSRSEVELRPLVDDGIYRGGEECRRLYETVLLPGNCFHHASQTFTRSYSLKAPGMER